MARYFFDLDDGKRKFVDSVGTELADVKMVPSEAIGFSTTIAKDVRDDADLALVASVRNEQGQIIFTTTLTLQSDWLDVGHVATTANLPLSSPDAVLRCK